MNIKEAQVKLNTITDSLVREIDDMIFGSYWFPDMNQMLILINTFERKISISISEVEKNTSCGLKRVICHRTINHLREVIEKLEDYLKSQK